MSNALNRAATDARRAFTLVEMLVVIAVIAMLAGMVLAVSYKVKDKARRDNTRNLLDQVEGGLEIYRDTNGRWPSFVHSQPTTMSPAEAADLAQILRDCDAIEHSQIKEVAGQDVVVDYWNNPIELWQDGNNAPGLDVWSPGPDGTSGNADDVVNWTRTGER